MIIDIICILIGVLLIAIGYKKGFLRTVFSFFSFFIAIILAFTLEPSVSAALERTPIAEKIETAVYERLVEKDAQEIKEEENDFSVSFMEEAEKEISETVSSLRESAARETTKTIIRVLSILLVVIITKILIHLISALLKAASHLPIIRHFDRLLGGAVGLLTAYLIIELAFLLLGIFEMTAFASSVIQSLESSVIGKALYENNFILNSFLTLG